MFSNEKKKKTTIFEKITFDADTYLCSALFR